MNVRIAVDERILLCESLSGLSSVDQLQEWVCTALLPTTGASSAVLAAGILKPSLRVQPLVHTDSFPQSLVGSFQGRNSAYVVPLLQEVLASTQGCLIQPLDPRSALSNDNLWQPCLAAKGVRDIVVCASRSTEGQFLYLCLTNPRDCLRGALASWLPIACLHIREVLARQSYWRQLTRADRAGGRLSASEITILRWVSVGKTNFEIAAILGISPTTVKNKVQTIITKLNVSNRTHAVSKYFSQEYGTAFDVKP